MDALTFTLILVCIVLVVFVISGFMLWILSRKRLGVAFPRLGKGFVLQPSGFYKEINIRPGGKDTFESPDKKYIFHAHNATSYKSTSGGPTIAIIDSVSEFAQNARVLDYILKLKEGTNVIENGVRLRRKFPTLDEAYLYYYENIYLPRLPKPKDAPDDWLDKEFAKVHAARGIIEAKSNPEYISMDNLPHPDAMQQTQQLQQEEEYGVGEMSDPDYEKFKLTIAGHLISDGNKIFPEYFDGEALTLNDVAKWMHSPAPENTLKGEYDRGYSDGHADAKKEANDMFKYILMIAIIVMVGAIAYTIVK